MSEINKNILLTGSSGFLGSAVVDSLNSNGYTTYNIGRNSSKTTNQIQCDLSTSIPNIPNILFEKIIHVAGKAHSFPKTKEEEEEFYRVNVKGTENLLFVLEKIKQKPKQFIFISTVAVYGKNEGVLIDEYTALNANTPYGISKQQAEEIIINWCDKFEVNYLILRLPLIVGKNPPGNLGDMKRAIHKGTYVRISKNTAQKSVVLVEDIAQLIANVEVDRKGIFHLTDGIHPSFNEIEQAMEERLQKKIRLSLPLWILKPIAKIGDILSNISKKEMPISTIRLNKILSTLTFDDSKAAKYLNWYPNNSIDFIKKQL